MGHNEIVHKTGKTVKSRSAKFKFHCNYTQSNIYFILWYEVQKQNQSVEIKGGNSAVWLYYLI
jgi:hypothetical protein